MILMSPIFTLFYVIFKEDSDTMREWKKYQNTKSQVNNKIKRLFEK